MARIAEDLALLLLDNASAQPALGPQARCYRLRCCWILAHACRIRPAVDSEPVEAGRLVALIGPEPTDPVVIPGAAVIAAPPDQPGRRDRKTASPDHRRGVLAVGARRSHPPGSTAKQRLQRLQDGARVAAARPDPGRRDSRDAHGGVVRRPPARPRDGDRHLAAAYGRRAGRWCSASTSGPGSGCCNRAADIASGSWVGEAEPELAEVNLAVTTAAIRQALAPRNGG